ncbi:unnamed protein product [Tuber aestivum]|uniref:Uncharacterized protein n=1 Tax=Tuber aestivum TaxID=59557 RepID=A0A292PYR3_9PEZI|nr:unnamed protein product [Tuber aestivum]
MDRRLVPAPDKPRGVMASFIPGFGRDNAQLQQNTKPADEARYRWPIQRNTALDAALAGLEKERENLSEANERLQHDNEGLRIKVKTLENIARELNGRLDSQTEELKNIQAQEYQKSKGVPRESHEAISSQFREIFRQCADWARDYFKIKMADFDVRGFPEFERELEEVSWSSSDWGNKVHFKASHLVQAVLGNMICEKILASPFYGTPQDFQELFQNLYKIKNRSDRAEAQRWRASSLQAYYSCKRWPLSGEYSPSLQAYKNNNATEILRHIEKVLRPIITAYYPNLSDQETQVQTERLFSIIKDAKTLGEKMGKQASELRVLSKSWFSKRDRLFTPDDDRMENRYGGEDYDSQDNLRVDLILSPGFLKHGNDNAENLDDWDVWTPAIVEIHDPARLLPPPPPRPPTAPTRTPMTFVSGALGELPGGKQQQAAVMSNTASEQERDEDEESEDKQAFTNARLADFMWV